MDVFLEYLVKKKISFPIHLLRALILTLGVIIFMIGMTIFGALGLADFFIIGFAIGVGALFGAIYLFRSFNVEYEYSFVNGEMDVDQITSQTKRKRLTTVVCADVENMGEYKERDHANKRYQKVIYACADPKATENIWFVQYTDKKFGNTLLVFNPPEKLVNAIRGALPSQVAFSVFGRR